MLFYQCFDNNPFRAIIVSGLLAALNNLSEIEIRDQGIQSIEMRDMRWTYLNSQEKNLLLIAADNKEQSTEIMRSQLVIVLDLFVKKYHIDLKYWEEGAANLEYFENFDETLKMLAQEWIQVNESTYIGKTLDILAIFQEIFIKYISIIQRNYKKRKYIRILKDLSEYSPHITEWENFHINPDAFRNLKLYIPKVDLKRHLILFESSDGDNLITEEKLGLEPNYMKSFFYGMLQHYNITIQKYTPPKKWYKIQCQEFLPLLISKWDQLKQLKMLKILTKSLLTYKKPKKK